MTNFSLKKKIKFTAFAERRNQHSCKNASTADLKGPEKDDLLQTSLMQECFNFKS
jgi:hypothetical protein